jgi:hypothetical protein
LGLHVNHPPLNESPDPSGPYLFKKKKDYRTTTPPNTTHSVKHTFPICTGIGEKIQNSRNFLTGITISRGVAEITFTAEISEIPVEKKIPKGCRVV